MSMIVFVDGENFRQRLASVLVESHVLSYDQSFRYNLRGLLEELLKTPGLDILYYHSRIKLPKGYLIDETVREQINRIRNSKRNWHASLSSQNIRIIRAGNLKIRTGKTCRNCHVAQDIIQEKGVDVRLALDIFETSIEDNRKDIAVFSSDTDICPAYYKARSRGARIMYLCFELNPNKAVMSATDKTIMIPTWMAIKHLLT